MQLSYLQRRYLLGLIEASNAPRQMFRLHEVHDERDGMGPFGGTGTVWDVEATRMVGQLQHMSTRVYMGALVDHRVPPGAYTSVELVHFVVQLERRVGLVRTVVLTLLAILMVLLSNHCFLPWSPARGRRAFERYCVSEFRSSWLLHETLSAFVPYPQ